MDVAPAVQLPDAPSGVRPLVFVAMPFGQKRDERRGYVIDFDAIYQNGIKPGIEGLDVDVIRADEERSGGVIHVAMFERLLLAEITIVDVTMDNANVFYELGVRHAARPSSTIIVCSSDRILPFDIAMIRAVPYVLADGTLEGENAAAFASTLKARIAEMLTDREVDSDSPLFKLIQDYPGVTISLDEASSFRDRTQRFESVRQELEQARALREAGAAVAKIREIEQRELHTINEANFELVVDLLLSYRDVKAFDALLTLVDRLPKDLYNRSVRVQQLKGFALNKRNRDDDRSAASALLQTIVAKTGDDPETCGLLGSIAKVRYDAAASAGDAFKVKAFLDEAIRWYRRGFIADSRDYYPGINLCLLLAIKGDAASLAELGEMLPSVKLAVRRSGGVDSDDFWVVATALSAAVLSNDWDTAATIHGRIVALAASGASGKPQSWMLESTHSDLVKLSNAGIGSIDVDSLKSLIEAVESTMKELGNPLT